MSQTKPNARMDMAEFCERYHLHPHFIPVDARSVDEWETLSKVQTLIENTPKYAQTLTPTNAPITIESPLVQTYLWTCGSYPVTQNTKPLWANPRYIHGGDGQHPRHTREYHIEKAIEVPTIKRNEIAQRFSIASSTLDNYMWQNDTGFRERRRESKKRLGRSIKTTSAWSDYSVEELKRRIPNTPNSTVNTWVYEFALEDGWQTPTKPKTVRWL